MQYVEVTIEEAMEMCDKNTKVLVAIQNLKDTDVDIVFVPKKKDEYAGVFEDIKTAASLKDDFVQQLKLFTEKQDIRNIRAKGLQKIVLLKE